MFSHFLNIFKFKGQKENLYEGSWCDVFWKCWSGVGKALWKVFEDGFERGKRFTDEVEWGFFLSKLLWEFGWIDVKL